MGGPGPVVVEVFLRLEALAVTEVDAERKRVLEVGVPVSVAIILSHCSVLWSLSDICHGGRSLIPWSRSGSCKKWYKKGDQIICFLLPND
jgi:hypothetical protein